MSATNLWARARNNPKHCHFERKREICFYQELENSRFLVASGLLGMTRSKVSSPASTNPKPLSFRAEARNLLLTKSWRTADSSSLRLLGMTSKKVQGRLQQTPNMSFRAKREICFRAKDHPTTNLAVGYKLRRRNPAIPRALIPRRILQGMSS